MAKQCHAAHGAAIFSAPDPGAGGRRGWRMRGRGRRRSAGAGGRSGTSEELERGLPGPGRRHLPVRTAASRQTLPKGSCGHQSLPGTGWWGTATGRCCARQCWQRRPCSVRIAYCPVRSPAEPLPGHFSGLAVGQAALRGQELALRPVSDWDPRGAGRSVVAAWQAPPRSSCAAFAAGSTTTFPSVSYAAWAGSGSHVGLWYRQQNQCFDFSPAQFPVWSRMPVLYGDRV